MWGVEGLRPIQKGDPQPCRKLQPAALLGPSRSWGHPGIQHGASPFSERPTPGLSGLRAPLEGHQASSGHPCPTPKLCRET